jgi:signal transduction histidine kinase
MIDDLSSSVRQLLLAQTEEELCHAAVAALDRLLDADQSTVIPADGCAGDNQAWASTGSLDVPDQRPLISGIVGQSYASGESWIVDDLMDTRSASTQSRPYDPAQYRSLLCVPVDEWGVLVAVEHDAAAFSDDDLEAVEQLQSYVTAAFTRITTSEAKQDEHDRIEEVARLLEHDVSSPLTVANGHLELAREEYDSEHLVKVATAHDRLEELIDTVVTLARTGRHVGATKAIDLQEIAERAWTMVETREAELTIAESTTIMADESCLSELFENLFRNAVVHGGSAVTIEVGCLDEDDGFYVADSGVGIPPSDRNQVFESGYSSADEQTGLGLSIVQRIVEAHDWDIEITKSVTDGARFEITGVSDEASIQRIQE